MEGVEETSGTLVKFIRFVLGLAFLLLQSQAGHATEPVSGWGNVKFGMSRADVRRAYNSDDIDCDDPSKMAPYECSYEAFDTVLDGIKWGVSVYFVAKFGAAKIELNLSDTNLPQVPSLYRSFKRDLTQKYGDGTARPFGKNTCAIAQQRWDAGQVVPNAGWIIEQGESYRIQTATGTVSIGTKIQTLCGNTPQKPYNQLKNSLWRLMDLTYSAPVRMPSQF